MNRTIMTALILAATVLAGASAFEWPVSELYPVSIFGQKKEQSVECGIVLEKRSSCEQPATEPYC